MATQHRLPSKLGFGPFEVNALAGELRKSGVRIRLPGQPFEILLALLAHPGEVVTREKLRQQIWGDGTFVDFEHGLSAAMNKLRQALGDSAGNPRHIETVPGRGYRFIGSIQQESTVESAAAAEVVPVPALSPAPPSEIAPKTPQSAPGLPPWILIAVALAVVLAGFVLWFLLHRGSAGGRIQVQQLTTNSAENPVWRALVSPDGKYLAYGDVAGIKIRLISTGETHLLPKPASLSAGETWLPAAWFPDRTRILASAEGRRISAWSISVIGATAVRLRDNALVYSVSPDGSLIAFTTGRDLVSMHNRPATMNTEIWVMGSGGENARKVIGGDDRIYFGSVQWSPNGKRIAYRKLRFTDEASPEYNMESCDLNGRTAPAILSSRQSYFNASQTDLGIADNFAWLPDGRIIYAVHEPTPNRRDRNLWAIAVDPNSGEAHGGPHRITNIPGFRMEGLSMTIDGRRLVFESGVDQSQVYVHRILPAYRLDTPRRLTYEESYNSPWSWTADSKAVIFRSDRTGTFSLYRQGLNQDDAELIPTGPETIGLARVTPDGEWLIYAVLSNVKFPLQSQSSRLMRVPVWGGAPQLLFETKADAIDFDCPRRPGAQCIFSESNPHDRRIFSRL